jgi:hypothetical protein
VGNVEKSFSDLVDFLQDFFLQKFSPWVSLAIIPLFSGNIGAWNFLHQTGRERLLRTKWDTASDFIGISWFFYWLVPSQDQGGGREDGDG